MKPRHQTSQAFRHALETRLIQQSAQSGVDVMRLRRMVAFDRLLARLFSKQSEQERQEEQETPWLLKGGYAMELRLGYRARTTRDIDLTLPDLRRITGIIDTPIPKAGRGQSEA